MQAVISENARKSQEAEALLAQRRAELKQWRELLTLQAKVDQADVALRETRHSLQEAAPTISASEAERGECSEVAPSRADVVADVAKVVKFTAFLEAMVAVTRWGT